MTDYVCLARRFPAKGIDGVLGVPVTSPDEIDSYLEELPVPVAADKVRFVRLTAIPEKSQSHLKSGDVVVKYSGLSERFLDVLRPVETASMNTNYKSGEIDWPLAEEAREKAVESALQAASADNTAMNDPGETPVFVEEAKPKRRRKKQQPKEVGDAVNLPDLTIDEAEMIEREAMEAGSS